MTSAVMDEDSLKEILLAECKKIQTVLMERLFLNELPQSRLADDEDQRLEIEHVEKAWENYQEEQFRLPEPTVAEKSFADKMLFQTYKDPKMRIEFLTKLFVLCMPPLAL